MAGLEPRQPEQYYHYEPEQADFNVHEIAADQAGGLSPFGSDIEFPLPISELTYEHPGPAARPHLAGDGN